MPRLKHIRISEAVKAYHPEALPHPSARKPAPGTGTRTVRLQDIPLAERLAAADRVLREAKDAAEALRILDVALDPGDRGGRIMEEAA